MQTSELGKKCTRLSGDEECINFRPSPNFKHMRKYLKSQQATSSNMAQEVWPPLPPYSPPPEVLIIPKQEVEDDEYNNTPMQTEFKTKEEVKDKNPDKIMCRQFARGMCTRGATCIYVHELILPQLPGVYTFCKNFQNTVCNFPRCKFVHATVFEKEHFHRTGYLPPHTLRHLKESNSALGPPTALEGTSAEASHVFFKPPPPSMHPGFDPSRPPPPFAQPSTSRGIRRPLENDSEAGPSKLRKMESSNDSSCGNGVQQHPIRIELYNQQLEQLHPENEKPCTNILKKMNAYERKKQIVKNSLNPERFRRVEDYIENGSPIPFTQWNETSFLNYFLSPMPSSSALDDRSALLHQRATRARPTISSTDVLSTPLELLSNVPSAAERSTTSDSRSSEPDLNRPITSGLASLLNGLYRFLSENSSPPGPSASRYLPGRSFGDVSAAPSNVARGARAYGDGAERPAPLPLLPYLANTYSHPYADNVVAGPSTHAEDIAGSPRYPPAQVAPPRQYHPSQGEGAPASAVPPVYMPAYSSSTQPPNPTSFYGHFPSNNYGVGMTQAPYQ